MKINLISKNNEKIVIDLGFPMFYKRLKIRKLLAKGYVFEKDTDADIAVDLELF